jgi:hypothetical protein
MRRKYDKAEMNILYLSRRVLLIYTKNLCTNSLLGIKENLTIEMITDSHLHPFMFTLLTEIECDSRNALLTMTFVQMPFASLKDFNKKQPLVSFSSNRIISS